MTYFEKLKDPRWQKKRLEILERDKWMCQHCFDEESTLNIHHIHYRTGFDPWDYSDSDLLTLCESCHESISHEMRRLKLMAEELARVDEQFYALLEVADYLFSNHLGFHDIHLAIKEIKKNGKNGN